MKKRTLKSKILSGILALSMLAGLLPLSAFAEDTMPANSETITAVAAPEVAQQEITVGSTDTPTLPPTDLSATLTKITWAEVPVQTPEGETPPENEGETPQTEWQATTTTENVPVSVEWTLPEGVTFSAAEVNTFTYTAKLIGDAYTASPDITMPTFTVNVVAAQDTPQAAPAGAASSPTKTISKFTEPNAIEIAIGDERSEQAIIGTFPMSLAATVNDTEGESVPVTAWRLVYASTADGAFSTAQAGEFYYEPTLAEGYTLAETATLPNQLVQVGDVVHAPTPASTGDFTVVGGTLGTDYSYENNTLTILKDTALTISGTTNTDTIVVQDGVNANITLKDVNIDVNATNMLCPFAIAGTATANIILQGSNTLKSGRGAGLQVQEDATLTILKESTGSLNAYGTYNSAGIGSESDASAGTINIHGGNIYAEGAFNGAGIGSGYSTGVVTNGGKITITGGIVTAVGGNGGAGIGGGNRSAGAVVVITGGNVYATGGSDASGIGGGRGGGKGSFSTIDSNNISGNAFIEVVTNSVSASFIDDESNIALWSGVIFKGNSGMVYDTPTIETNIVIKSGKTLEVPAGSQLTIPTGKQMDIEVGAAITITEANGIQNDGIIFNYGTINTVDKIGGSGQVYPETGNVNPNLSVVGTDIYLRVDGSNKQFSYSGSTWQNYTGTMTITGSTTENHVSVLSGEHDVIFNKLSISRTRGNPFQIDGGASVHVTLVSDNYLSAGGFDAALMLNGTGQELTITKESTGSLTAISTGHGAAIGGDDSVEGGTVNIYGGSIVAMSTSDGAGIGGGQGGDGGTVNIYGGSIEASSAGGMSIGRGSGSGGSGSINYLAQPENIYQIQILAGDSSTNTTAYSITDAYNTNKYIKIEMQDATPAVSLGTPLTYNATQQTQNAVVKLGAIIVPDTSYTLSGNTATNAGSYTLSVSALNLGTNGMYDSTEGINYIGSSNSVYTQNYGIAKAPLRIHHVLGQSKPYDGTTNADVMVSLQGMVGLDTLLPGRDYTVNANFASADVGEDIAISGSITLQNDNYELSNSALPSGVSANITAKSIASATVTLGAPPVANGSVQTQRVSSVVLDGITLAEGIDYTISGNTATNAGSYTLSISGVGNYIGTLAVPFTVVGIAEEALPYEPDSSLDVGGSTVPGGNTLHVTQRTEAEKQQDLAKLREFAQQNGIMGEVHFLADITMTDAAGNEVQPQNGNTRVRISVPGLTTADTVTVLHIKDDGTVEKIPDVTVGNGYVEFYPTSFSVYSVIVHKAGTGVTSALSPQTGVN